MAFKVLISLVLGYLLGCIQTPYLFVRFIKRMDIREFGSKNAGATNATRLLGFKYGVLIGFIDVLKGIAAVLMVKWFYSDNAYLMFISGAACMVGHIFPFYLQFKGGKGVATTIGMLLAAKFSLGLTAIIIIAGVTLITNYVALGSVIVYLLLPFGMYFLGYSYEVVLISIFICALGIYKHKSNIIRLLHGKENGLIKKNN